MLQSSKAVLFLILGFLIYTNGQTFTFRAAQTTPTVTARITTNMTTAAVSKSTSTTSKLNVTTTIVPTTTQTTKASLASSTTTKAATAGSSSTVITTLKSSLLTTGASTLSTSTTKATVATTTSVKIDSTTSTTRPTVMTTTSTSTGTTLKNALVTTTAAASTTTSSTTTKPPTTTPATTSTSTTTSTKPSTLKNGMDTTSTTIATTVMPYNGCYCVTNGSCSLVGGNSTIVNDGSGQIDMRIVNPARDSNVTSGTTDAITSPVSTGIPVIAESETSCPTVNKYLETCCPANGYQCGNVFPPIPTAKVMGGRAKFGEFPWQGIIFTSDNTYVGSCVLIDQLNVLTVVHRLNRFPNAVFKVRFGDWDTSATTEPLPFKEFSVSRVTAHPGYVASSLINSIAVLRLKTPVPLGRMPTIGTACLPSNPITTNLTCFISGWGRNDFAYGSNQAIQRKVDVRIVTKKDCQTILRMTKLGNNFNLDKGFMCAGGETGKDACTGDGGAPLVCQVANRWYAVGLVSWGISCGQEIPGVYMDINNYIPWIQSVTSTPCPSC